MMRRCRKVAAAAMGRRSEVKFFGSQKANKRFFSVIDGIEYDELFIFDEVGWNFEPSEMRGLWRRSDAQVADQSRPAQAQTSNC